MTTRGTSTLTIFEKLEQDLDPASGYMIFERVAHSIGQAQFSEVFEILRQKKFAIGEYKIVFDEIRGRALLVVKIGPGRTDGIMQEFMNMGLPEDITYYAYGSQGS